MNQDLCDSRTRGQATFLPSAFHSRSLRHRLRCGCLRCRSLLRMDRRRGRGEERMRDEILEADAVLGVPLEQVVEEVGELRRGTAGNPRCQTGISLVELLQCLKETLQKTYFNQMRFF